MSLPAIIAGVASLFVLVALVFYLKRDKAPSSQSTATGGGSSAGQTSGSGTHTDPIHNVTTPQTSYNFSWVDGNDRKGNQILESTIYDVSKNTFEKTTNLVFEKGRTYKFQARIAALDTIKNEVLKNWAFAWHIFDANGSSLASGKGALGSTGYAQLDFTITPATPGVYRFRVALGDAADEDSIVFWMPADVKPTSALGTNETYYSGISPRMRAAR